MSDNVLSSFTPTRREERAYDHTFRVGIIGTGWIAEAHAERYLNQPDVKIVALADLIPGKAEAFAKRYGIANGYLDGTFRPEATITRAEVTAITNRLLDRAADEDYVDDHAGELRQFPDVSASYWAYHDIVEATNDHDYTKPSSGENWTELN